MELDVDVLKKSSSDYAAAKELAIKGIFSFDIPMLLLKNHAFGDDFCSCYQLPP